MGQAQKFALTLGLIFAVFAHATPPSSWTFRVLSSPHFDCVFRSDQKDLAKTYLLAAERAREFLLPIFKEAPERTLIYIDDSTDFSNGMASFLPYPMITVYPVLPSTLDTLDDYGDWPLEMMVHEYTHILNMYPRHSFYVALKYVFGGVVRPNAVLPKWYLEGLAVDMESDFTDHGRLRAVETRAQARALVLSDRLKKETVDTVNEQELNSWPSGARPYLFGGWWWKSLERNNGREVIYTWNQNFSRRLPFFLNGPMREQTGLDASGLLDRTLNETESQARADLRTLNGAELSPAALDDKGQETVFAVSPSGRQLVYLVGRPGFGVEVRLKVRTRGREAFFSIPSRLLFKTSGTTRIRWLDENRFLFDREQNGRAHVQYRDLEIYDLRAMKSTRLTENARAEEPGISPDGQRVAYIDAEGGRTELKLLPLNRDASAAALPAIGLMRTDLHQRLSSPEFLDNGTLLFVFRDRSGKEQIESYDLSSRKIQVWLPGLHSAQHLRKTKIGMLSSDDGSGVRNVYLIDPLKKTAVAVTNTPTHIETADYDPQTNQILFSEMTGEGRKLKVASPRAVAPHRLEPLAMAPPPAPKTQSIPVYESSYQPIKYLVPQYWIPFVYTVENGGILLQGTSSNSDPAGRNVYNLAGAYDTLTKKPSYGIAYSNFSLPTEIDLSYARAITYLGASQSTSESQIATAGLAMNTPNRFTRIAVGGIWNDTLASTFRYRRLGPQAMVRYSTLDEPLNRWFGGLAEYSYQNFIKRPGYMGYDRSYAHLAGQFQLPWSHKIFVQARGSYSPRLSVDDSVDIGDRNVGANYLVNLANSDFLLRGYGSGTFGGREVVNANFEYSFSLKEMASGWGTFPLFVRAMEPVLFFDTMAVDGWAYRSQDASPYHRSTLKQFYSGTGAELRFSTTAGYHLPVTLTLGAYYGLNQRYGGGFSPFLGLGLGDLGPLQ